nr:MAG: hypothetical protein 1 [Tombusviridae sp.]
MVGVGGFKVGQLEVSWAPGVFKVEINNPDLAKDGKVSVDGVNNTDVHIVAGQNVTGEVEGVDEPWHHGFRRWLVDLLPTYNPRENRDGDKCLGCIPSPFGRMRDAFEPSDNPMEAGVVLAVVNGDLAVEGAAQKEEAPKSGGRDPETVVKVMTGRRARRSKKALRIPVLAGDVASGLKLRHGYLVQNAENRELVRADATRRIEALRRDGDPLFKTMRNHDLYLVAMHAAEMFWIASEDEEDVQALYGHSELSRLRSVRTNLASGPSSC